MANGANTSAAMSAGLMAAGIPVGAGGGGLSFSDGPTRQDLTAQGGGIDASGWNINFGSGSASSSSSSSGSGILSGLGLGLNDCLLILIAYLIVRGVR